MAKSSVAVFRSKYNPENQLIKDLDLQRLLTSGESRLIERLKALSKTDGNVRCCQCKNIFPISRTVPKSLHNAPDLSKVHLRCRGCSLTIRKTENEAVAKLFGVSVNLVKFAARALGNVQRRKFPATPNFDCDITLNYMCALWARQKGMCALSGVMMIANTKGNYFSDRASLDRIDSKRGYQRDNVQWVCWQANLMKMDATQSEFIVWCQEISSHQRKIVKNKKLTG